MRTLTGSSLFTIQPAIPHKSIETNEKKPLHSINVESGPHLGFNIDLGNGESILKESE